MNLLRIRDVQARTHLSRTTIWRLARSGDFPVPARLGPRAMGWPEVEIDAWINARLAARPS